MAAGWEGHGLHLCSVIASEASISLSHCWPTIVVICHRDWVNAVAIDKEDLPGYVVAPVIPSWCHHYLPKVLQRCSCFGLYHGPSYSLINLTFSFSLVKHICKCNIAEFPFSYHIDLSHWNSRDELDLGDEPIAWLASESSKSLKFDENCYFWWKLLPFQNSTVFCSHWIHHFNHQNNNIIIMF